MPHRLLREVLRTWIGACCPEDAADNVADRLLEVGVRPPALTVMDPEDLDAIPNGAAVAVGNLVDGVRIGRKQEHAILFVGERDPYPFHLEGLDPPLPCTVIWVPQEAPEHWSALYTRIAAGLFGLDERQLLREYGATDA